MGCHQNWYRVCREMNLTKPSQVALLWPTCATWKVRSYLKWNLDVFRFFFHFYCILWSKRVTRECLKTGIFNYSCISNTFIVCKFRVKRFFWRHYGHDTFTSCFYYAVNTVSMTCLPLCSKYRRQKNMFRTIELWNESKSSVTEKRKFIIENGLNGREKYSAPLNKVIGDLMQHFRQCGLLQCYWRQIG